jgi:lipoprotein-anchoring transpeptidase ErfK/SrfK
MLEKWRSAFWDVTARKSLLIALAAPALLTVSCDRIWPTATKPKPKEPAKQAASATMPSAPIVASVAPAASKSEPLADAGTSATSAPHPGPWLTVLVPSAAIYAEPKSEKDTKLGYAQSGARLAIKEKPKPGEHCPSGWVELVDGGFVCSNVGTLDDKEPRTKFTLRVPNLDELLPYTYARNAKNGTPMYKTVPTRDQMKHYEPYLASESQSAKKDGPDGKSSTSEQNPTPAPSASNTTAAAPSSSPSIATSASPPPPVASAAPPEEDENTPWWQRQNAEDKLHEMKLSDLRSDSDDILAQRMVKGFYVAVDRTFRWNGRTWYKTTKHMVVPADRFGIAGPSDFKGVELGNDWQLPVAWVCGGLESAATYEIDADGKRIRAAGKVSHFEPIQLTDATTEIKGVAYVGLKDGKWVKRSQVRMTNPGTPPAGIKDDEHWIDIILSQQTLVAYTGTRPVFATLISSGKSSKIKDKDHSTPIGTWRIREKHITTTMDGDGTAAGDLPYSIEDVPYVMYFFRSYAVHGAFWHRNYGVQMSHGCVNLSPLDAKRLFFLTDPPLPQGWHGVWSSSTRPGSWVVVHE